MERKHKNKISQYRERLDKTLTSPDLTDDETLKTLVKNHLLSSSQYDTEGISDSVLEKRTMEVSNFLDMLRSASVKDNEMSKNHEAPHTEWKLKQDTEDYRVMYREGPQGTRFHTLLVEGYVDAPVDVSLCVSWESGLYKKWWPQFNVPTFKIISSQCLQKVRIGEQISSVRMKLSWPLSAREALVHYFALEYFHDDLIIVLLNTISDLESIDKSTHGFSNDGIPEAKDMVRIDLVGGFALQKVTSDRSYFRTIGNMDIKMGFVPSSLINFISRQLIGSGFRLYQKIIATVATSDEDFGKALGDPLYTRIREALYSNNKANRALEPEDLKSDTCNLPEEHVMKAMQDDMRDTDQIVLVNENATESSPKNAPVIDWNAHGQTEEEEIPKEHVMKSMQDDMMDLDQITLVNENATESSPENAPVIDWNAHGEIEEEEIEESRKLESSRKGIDHSPTNHSEEKCPVNNKKNLRISSEVEEALETLEKVISMVREFGFNTQARSPSRFINEVFPNLEKGARKNSISSEDGEKCSDEVVGVEASKEEIVKRASDEPRNSSSIQNSRRMGSNSYTREVNHNRIAPASPEQNLEIPSETYQVALCSSNNGTTEAPILGKKTIGNWQASAEANGICENSLHDRKKFNQQKKNRFCCMHFFPGH